MSRATDQKPASDRKTDLDSQYKPVGIAAIAAATICKKPQTDQKTGQR